MQEGKLMYYVYELIDPRTNVAFYVGKGTGRRAETHLWKIPETRNTYKENKIASIRNDGYEPEIKYVIENIEDEQIAYAIEESLIKKYGRKGYDKDGILTNVCPNNRPPNHKGKTYAEIYGTKRAKEQKEMRSRLQKERGGYGPKHHSVETKEKFKILNTGINNPMYGKKQTQTTKQLIGVANSKFYGRSNKKSKRYELTSPTNSVHVMYGGELRIFCKENKLSYATFRKNLSDGWPPSKRGKNVGWKIKQGMSL